MRRVCVLFQIVAILGFSTVTAAYVLPDRAQHVASVVLNLLGVLLAALIALLAVIATLVPVITNYHASNGAVPTRTRDRFLSFLRSAKVDASTVLGATVVSFALYVATHGPMVHHSWIVMKLVTFLSVLSLLLSLNAVWDLFRAVFRLQENLYR